MIPTWTPPDMESMKIAKELGCTVIENPHPRRIQDIPGLAGSTVVNFCNERAYAAKTTLDKLGCRMVAVPCMCYPAAGFRAAVATGHVKAVVFQSRYQQEKMSHRLKSFNYQPEMGHLIRGYIDWPSIDFQPVPREPDQPFVIGRISRDSTNKWNPDWWKMYGMVPHRKAVVLGYGAMTKRQCGPVPEWATAYKPGVVTAESVYRQLHAYVTCNGGVDENWPRTGLEAMAYGCPIVAENDFGWQEMVANGESGLLGSSWQEIGELATQLANDEPLRQRLALTARERLNLICNPDEIWDGWKEVLDA